MLKDDKGKFLCSKLDIDSMVKLLVIELFANCHNLCLLIHIFLTFFVLVLLSNSYDCDTTHTCNRIQGKIPTKGYGSSQIYGENISFT